MQEASYFKREKEAMRIYQVRHGLLDGRYTIRAWSHRGWDTGDTRNDEYISEFDNEEKMLAHLNAFVQSLLNDGYQVIKPYYA